VLEADAIGRLGKPSRRSFPAAERAVDQLKIARHPRPKAGSSSNCGMSGRLTGTRRVQPFVPNAVAKYCIVGVADIAAVHRAKAPAVASAIAVADTSKSLAGGSKTAGGRRR
jgi:hypothetical protein